MLSNSRILIISCSSGLGHIRAGEALRTYLTQNSPHTVTDHYDAADYGGIFLKTAISRTYDAMVTYYPPLFGELYKAADTKTGSSILKKTAPLFRYSSRPLLKAIEKFAPDRIITTHFIVPYLLEHATLNCPLDIVVTDYRVNRIWLGPGIRHVFVPTSSIAETLRTEHPSVIVSGIPIDPAFYTLPRHHLDHLFSPSTPTVLVLSGGKGYTDTCTIVSELLMQAGTYAVLAVAGNNRRLQKKLETLSSNRHPYHVLGFTHDMAELMKLSDCIVTKPGGLSISEALYLQKPLVLYPGLPGPELYNAAFITEEGYGVAGANPPELARLALRVLTKQIPLTTFSQTTSAQEIILRAV